MTDRQKLIELLEQAPGQANYEIYDYDIIADFLIANGVTFATDNNVGDKRIEELEAKLAEREEAVCNLRKKWQAAETHICTMCGNFDHKTDGNIVYGCKMCGELVGYPCCGKFTSWIPVTERLPEPETEVMVLAERRCYSFKAKGVTTHHIVTTGMYEDGTKNTEDSNWWWETDGFEYDEELDAYIIPEGWWEYKHYNGDETHNYAIDDVVTHWMPLPEPPKGE